ncbi:MAG TPA: isochorismatase family protein [Syntrophomonadaceae bacterium]|nr:isochorismatase family protein [Syntrophomonadaceae bacterium]
MEANFLKTLDANNSILLLVDYQDKLFDNIESNSCTDIKNNVIALAQGAEALGISAVLTTIRAKTNGPFLPEIVEIFPHALLIDRKLPSFDILEDRELMEALKQTGKKRLVLSGLWTSMCMCHTSLHGLRVGFDILGVMDTTGSERLEAHTAALQRMIEDGAICTCHLDADRFHMDA